MKNIKFIKAIRLSLLVAMLSIGFTTMSCSPSDDLSDDTEEIVERRTYQRHFFTITGVYYESGIANPEYSLVKASLYSDTNEFIRIEDVLKSHEELMEQANEESWGVGKSLSTIVFIEYNYNAVANDPSGNSVVPLLINPDYETAEFQLSMHLSESIEDRFSIPSNSYIWERQRIVNLIRDFRSMTVFYQ